MDINDERMISAATDFGIESDESFGLMPDDDEAFIRKKLELNESGKTKQLLYRESPNGKLILKLEDRCICQACGMDGHAQDGCYCSNPDCAKFINKACCARPYGDDGNFYCKGCYHKMKDKAFVMSVLSSLARGILGVFFNL